ncbi:MAG: indole-3-glycerol phosphate synthase TrpC, partial [Clostridia bacterium]|nr:indole-3-glycerol phosphate synthase TrpC [Clostridia bacterium]
LSTKEISLICEVKSASPSKGVIAEDFPYVEIAKEYARAGAEAISVLTEPDFFRGADHHLWEIARQVDRPVLRKDFTIDEYMIYEARLLGASAVLLICALLDENTLARLVSLAHQIGLSALVETHEEREIEMALSAGARVVGVNNRDLTTFDVDLTLSGRLRHKVPPEILFVSESGITTPADVQALADVGVDAVLIGQTVMRSTDRTAQIRRLRGSHG